VLPLPGIAECALADQALKFVSLMMNLAGLDCHRLSVQ
jgi:hypothetical protein